MSCILKLTSSCESFFLLPQFKLNAISCSFWRSCKVLRSKATKRSSAKSYYPQKKKSLSCTFDLSLEICLRTISYCSKPISGLMAAVNYKMADLSRAAKEREEKEGGRMVKTHFGNLASPPLLLRVPTASNEGGFGRVNHFLQVVNSQGRQDESDVCVQIKWRHRSNTLASPAAFPLHSSSNAGKC